MRLRRPRRIAVTGIAALALSLGAVGAGTASASDTPPRQGGTSAAFAVGHFKKCLRERGERDFPEFGIYRVVERDGGRHLELRTTEPPSPHRVRAHYRHGVRACGRVLEHGHIAFPGTPVRPPKGPDQPPVFYKD
ncbi:hypothetical protein AB0J38_29170 [Streptomyces sp. NPDC050095]|uniref:hypothetical protein n=1 Tax=unclassified Streptomyces TaxID=2593676 RepID=UPI00343E2421